ncbi:MAG: lysozyme [Alphaproteobacteria bacterium]
MYAYPDPASGGEPWTIGIGATRYDGQGNVKRGQTITIARAVARFRETINKKYAPGVNSAINVPVSQAEFDALVSFHYNTGKIKSGTVDNNLNRGDRAAALATWRSYRLAAGRVMRGLINRRASEIALFKTGEYPARKIVLHTAPGAAVRYLDPSVFDGVEAPTPAIVEAFPPQTEIAQNRRRQNGNFLIQLGELILCLLGMKTCS